MSVEGLNVPIDVFIQKLIKTLIISGESDQTINRIVKGFVIVK